LFLVLGLCRLRLRLCCALKLLLYGWLGLGQGWDRLTECRRRSGGRLLTLREGLGALGSSMLPFGFRLVRRELRQTCA
jgi:hypothetical protein